jgi:hypothetical protein
VVKIRKQVYQLTPEDLNKFPVWEFASDEEDRENQDEATVRPYEVSGALEPSDGMFVVRAVFSLADGSSAEGYLTPPMHGDKEMGTLQPVVVTNEGQIGFWCGVTAPSSEWLKNSYHLLKRGSEKVFPLRFQSDVVLTDGPVEGIIPGFLVLEDWETGKTRTVR